MSLDLEFVRSQFPAFADPDTASWAHLENAGGSYACAPVIARLTDLFTRSKVQPEWGFAPSQRASDAMADSRQSMAAMFNAAPDELHFGPSTSQNTYVLAQAFRPLWDDGDEIIVTEQDHEANSGVWRRLAATGIVVKDWKVDATTGLLDPADLDELVGPRTRLIAMTHASNVAATINPVRLAADRVHAMGGHIVVDGVSYAPHRAVDVRALDCDVYLYSAYKTFGPHVGMMFTRSSVLAQLAHQGHFFNEALPSTRLTPAGPDHAVIGATGGIAEYFDALYSHHFGAAVGPVERASALSQLFATHEEALVAPLIEYLVACESVRVIGAPVADADVRAPTVAFYSDRRSSASIYDALIAASISCGYGHFYAHRLITALGLDPEDGVVRLSAVHYNSPDDIARALTVLHTLDLG